MKRLLAMTAALLLGGCVSYYYPQYDPDDGVYYAADDGHGSVRVSYLESAYYPYWSVDHFYFGGYWGSYSSSISFGYHWGYPYRPWYVYDPYPWPYYAGWGYRPYYWYGPRYHYAWYDPYWYWRHHRYRYYGHSGSHGGGHHGGGHGGGQGGGDYGTPPDRGVAFDDRQRDRELMTGGRGNARPPASTTTRRVTAGGDAAAVRYREERKQGRSRLEPVGSAEGPEGRPAVQVPGRTDEPVRQRRVTADGREVRSAAGRKVGQSRPEPVRPQPGVRVPDASRPVQVGPVARPSRSERPSSRSPERPVVPHGSNGSVRNAGPGKPVTSRTMPVSRGAPAADSRMARPSPSRGTPSPSYSPPPAPRPSSAPAPSSSPSMGGSRSSARPSSGSRSRGNARGQSRPD